MSLQKILKRMSTIELRLIAPFFKGIFLHAFLHQLFFAFLHQNFTFFTPKILFLGPYLDGVKNAKIFGVKQLGVKNIPLKKWCD